MELLLSSIIAFTSTNLDDLFILMLFFADKKYKGKEIVGGQYLGISALIAISFVGSFIGVFLPTSLIGLLGVMPIYLGLHSLWSRSQSKEEKKEIQYDKPKRRYGHVMSIATVTFANGGDNIGIYIPLFATLSVWERTLMILLFLCMVALWCCLGRYLSHHPLAAKSIDRYGPIFTPVLLILLGLSILHKSGSFITMGSYLFN